jgi:hypothetical protein
VANDGEPLIHPVTDLTAGIIGADEEQLARVGHPIPPIPPAPLGLRIALWMLLLISLSQAIDYFWHGGFWKGFFGIIGAGAAAVLRWGVVDGIRRSRWTSPQYRARYLEQKGR